MKKKILIEMVAIGASVAILGGCGGSSNNTVDDATTKAAEDNTTINNDIPVELDESKRPKFDEETELYSLNANDQVVYFELPKAWETKQGEDIDTKEIIQYYSQPAEQDVFIMVDYDDEPNNTKDDFISNGYNVADTTVGGLDAFYVASNDGEFYAYFIPFNDGRLGITLSGCKNKEKIKYLDMVVSSIYINSEELATTSEPKQFTSGLLVARTSNGNVLLDIIDPYTGEWHNYKTFPNSDEHDCPSTLNRLSKDQSKLYTSRNIDGETHVGWVNESGEFTDVTKMVTPSAGDFSALTQHNKNYFSLDDYFYYEDLTNGEKTLKRVPINNISPSSVEEMGSFTISPAYVEPFHNIDGTITIFSSSAGNTYEYYDSNMEYGLPYVIHDYDWVNKDVIVGIEDDSSHMTSHTHYTTLEKFTLVEKEPDSFFGHWHKEEYSNYLAPQIEGRVNSDPKVSPDKKSVAFLSQMIIGDDQTKYLFMVPIDGGDPQKVNTDYSFENVNVLDWIE